MILVIGSPEEAHAAFMVHKIQTRGGDVGYFDTRKYPSETRITFNADTPLSGHFQEGQGTRHIPFSDIHSVYWRYFHGVTTIGIDDPFLADMAYREIESALGSFFRSLDCLWVNSAHAIDMHRYKGYQLKLLRQAGLRVPETLVTNNAQHLVEFYERLHGNVIYKPVRGGAHTQKLTHDDLKPERLKDLAKAPVQFQEMISGVDVRVYYVDGELFPADIRTDALDFRDDPSADLVPIELPEQIQEQCCTLARLLDLKFSGIDIRRTPDGEFVFLEGNPSPMFVHFERVTGYPISDRLTDLLMTGTR